ncbi:MAG: DUF760 domain-containing protein [Microcoleaceae cyanobacterium]
MKNLSNRDAEQFERSSSGENKLWQYVQSMNPEVATKLSKPDAEVAAVMERNLIQMLGGLPSEHFDVSITTDRDHLARLLTSAMMSGYFLHNVKQRMDFEQSLMNQ